MFMLHFGSSRTHPANYLSLLAVIGMVLLFASRASQPALETPAGQAVLPEACLTDNPFFATSKFARGETFDDEPAVVAFRDSPDDSGHFDLARVGDLGAVYGIAYDPAKDLLYAGAYHKRNARYGPLGPGGVYEVEVNGGGVRPFLTVPSAGSNKHDPDDNYEPDELSRDYAGKTSLGDLDLSEDGTQLFVMNLNDRRIYRYALPDGTLLGRIDNGGESKNWSREARPFGLAFHDGWLFHAVVNSSENRQSLANLSIYVFASRPDGSAMREVAQVWMGHERPGNHEDWHPWPQDDDLGRFYRDYPHPMPTDIEFTDEGHMVLGIRDRYMDTGPSLTEGFRRTNGDILFLRKTGDLRWEYDDEAEEHFHDDNLPGVWDEIAIGGLARVRTRDVVVSTVSDPFRTYPRGASYLISAGAIWLDNLTGADLTSLGRGRGREELMYNAEYHDGPQGKAMGLGDLELICYIPPTPTPSPSPEPSDTPTITPTGPPSATPSPTASQTATATATRTPGPIYLPYGEKDKYCRPDAFYTDVVLVLDRSTSMLRPVTEGGIAKNAAALAAARSFVSLLSLEPDPFGNHDQVAVVGFNDTAWIETALTRDRNAAIAALDRIEQKTIEGTRLDLAFTWGQKPLDGPERIQENRPVVIMLTDGLPNRVPFGPDSPYPGSRRQEDSVLQAVDAVKAAGTRVYTIGLGNPSDILPWLLIDSASERWMYHYAPVPEDLEGIYNRIAATFDSCDPKPAPTPCVPEEQHADVVLVLDMSTSMYRTTRSGRTKHEAALDAARSFVAQLDLERDGWGRRDQVAIVGFNDEAWTEVGMSDDRAAVMAAIDRLPDRIAEGTRLDLALEEGQRAMGFGPRLQPNQPVVVLLTDGLPNRVPFGPGTAHPECDRQECTVLKLATAAKQAGSRLFTIGLGESSDVLRVLLEEAATSPDHYYFAPDGEDLEAIYRQIAGRFDTCP